MRAGSRAFRIAANLIGFGSPEIAVDEIVAPTFRRFQNGSAPFL